MQGFRLPLLYLFSLWVSVTALHLSVAGRSETPSITSASDTILSRNMPQAVISQEDKLINAAYAGQMDVVRELLSAGAVINAKHSATGLTALMEAAGKGHLDIVKFLIQSGADVNARVDWKNAEHHDVAAKYWKASRFVQLPGTANQKVLRVYGDSWTALMAAAEGGHVEIARLLLKSGAKVNAFVYAHWTTTSTRKIGVEEGHKEDRLHTYSRIAARRHPADDGEFSKNHLTRIKSDIGSDNSSDWDSDGLPKEPKAASKSPARRMFSLATGRYDDEDSVPPSVKVDPLECWTALMAATESGFTEVMKLLIEAGANVHAKCECGDALALAVENNQLNAIRLLIQEGANVNAKDRLGDTPLLIAVKNNNLESVRLLLQSGANPNVADRTLAGWSYRFREPATFAYLTQTALARAIDNENIEITKLLLQAKANVNMQAEDGSTILMQAVVQMEEAEIIKLLLQAKANVNQQNEDGNTALIFAVIGNQVEFIRLLLAAGADANIENKNGETALSLATDPEIVKLFRTLRTQNRSKR